MRVTDPFREMERFFDQFVETGFRGGGTMPMDAFRRDDEFVIRFDLPGVHPENLGIEVENRVLTVTAERSIEKTDEATWLVRERPAGKFSRVVRLGHSLDTGNVQADYDQGVLTITIPIQEEAKPRKIEVALGSKSNKVLEAQGS